MPAKQPKMIADPHWDLYVAYRARTMTRAQYKQALSTTRRALKNNLPRSDIGATLIWSDSLRRPDVKEFYAWLTGNKRQIYFLCRVLRIYKGYRRIVNEIERAERERR